MTLTQLDLTGDLAHPARLTVPDLLGWPQHRVRVSFECATSGTQAHRFEGPRLYDVLSSAGPGFDPARRKDRLRFLIAVGGADGHHALLSWAEIDPDFAHAPVLLAVSIDDTPLDRAGPQLVLPQDRCGARHISGIRAIHVDGGTGVPDDSASARHTRSRVGGSSVKRTPVASRSAWAKAGATGLKGLSLITLPASAACARRRMRISPVSGSTGTLNHCALKATERGVPPKCPSARGSWRWAAAKSSRWSARAREARRAGPAEGALAEVVAHAGQGAVGRPADGTAFAVVGGGGSRGAAGRLVACRRLRERNVALRRHRRPRRHRPGGQRGLGGSALGPCLGAEHRRAGRLRARGRLGTHGTRRAAHRGPGGDPYRLQPDRAR